MACLNPIHHYNLEVGQLKVGDWADFIVVKKLENFEVAQTFINGELVADGGNTLIPSSKNEIINHFDLLTKTPTDFQIKADGDKVRVIEALDGQLITPVITEETRTEGGMLSPIPSGIF